MNMADGHYQLDMDLIRSMTTDHSQQPGHSSGAFEGDNMFMPDGNLQDIHYMDRSYSSTSKPTPGSQTSTPLYHATHQPNDYMDQDDILTPLISPAITPSFSYHHKLHNGPIGTEMDFSPLTSPAMMPQQENHNYQCPPNSQQRHQYHQHHHQPFLQHEHHRVYPTSTPSSKTLQFESANDINDQYEELEKTKMMITRRLSELEKQQMTSPQGANNTTVSSQGSQQTPRNPTTYMAEYSDRTMSMYSNSLSGVFQQQVRLEPVTPASLMNLRQHERQKASSFPHQDRITANEFNMTMHMNNSNNSTCGRSYSASSSASPSAITTSPPPPPAPKRGKRKARQPSLSSDHQITKTTTRRSSSTYDKQQHPATPISQQSRTHASPRALKPLLISPALKPNQHQPLTPISHSPTTNHEAEHILATRSNYQNLMEGKAAALGIAFTPQIKSGIEVRRTAHKAAEQKRRDSLKEWFDRLRLEVEEGYVKKRSGLKSKVIREQQREGGVSKRQRSDDDDDGDDDVEDDVLKPLSKVLLLRYAYDYITHLKDTLAERDALIGTLTTDGADV